MGKSNPNLHKNRFKAIQKYVDFKIDLRKKLSPYEKRKIKTYYDEVNALTQRSFYPYKTKNKEKLKRVQEFAQHENLKLSQLNTAFIPSPEGAQVKVKIGKNGDVITESRNVITRGIKFDMEKFIKNPKEYAKSVIAKNKGIKRFKIQAGRYEIDRTYSPEEIINEIVKRSSRYSNDSQNNYFGNWMFGLNTFKFKNQGDFEEYQKAKTKSNEKTKREKRNERKRQEYAAKKKESEKLKKQLSKQK